MKKILIVVAILVAVGALAVAFQKKPDKVSDYPPKDLEELYKKNEAASEVKEDRHYN